MNYQYSEPSEIINKHAQDNDYVEIFGAQSIRGKKLVDGKCYLYVAWVTDKEEVFTWEPVEKFEKASDLLDLVDGFDRDDRRIFKEDYNEFLHKCYRRKDDSLTRPRDEEQVMQYIRRNINTNRIKNKRKTFLKKKILKKRNGLKNKKRYIRKKNPEVPKIQNIHEISFKNIDSPEEFSLNTTTKKEKPSISPVRWKLTNYIRQRQLKINDERNSSSKKILNTNKKKDKKKPSFLSAVKEAKEKNSIRVKDSGKKDQGIMLLENSISEFKNEYSNPKSIDSLISPTIPEEDFKDEYKPNNFPSNHKTHQHSNKKSNISATSPYKKKSSKSMYFFYIFIKFVYKINF